MTAAAATRPKPVADAPASGVPSPRDPSGQARPRRRGLEWLEAQADARALSSHLDPQRFFAGTLVLADGLVVVLAAAAAYALRYGPAAPPPHVSAATCLALLIMVNLTRSNARAALGAATLTAQLIRVARHWTLTMVGLLVLAYLTHASDTYARLWATAWFTLALAGFWLLRLALDYRMRRWRQQGRLARMVAIVDLDGTGRVLARRLRDDPAAEMRLLGVFLPTASLRGHAAETPPPATVDDLIALAQLFRIDDVLVTISWPGNAATQGVLRRLSTIPTTVRLCPVLPPAVTPLPCQAEMLLGSPTLVVCRRPLSGWHVVLKRLEDLLLGSLMLAILAPLMLIIALAVRLDSPGPALFRQRRLGFNNNPITVYKFRSMTHRTAADDAHVLQATRHDPRVTRIGRVLRRSSLDELPQLINVLRGEMSLVGPRPHAIAHNEQYAALVDDYLGRHRVQPGITGWAQVNGLRGETDTLDKMQKRVEFDLAYIDRWTVLFDLRIILQTALGMFFHRQAY